MGTVDIPVTVKMRTGTDNDHINALEIAQLAEAKGLQAVTIHGRTREGKFNGQAEYETIRLVKQNIGIPVIANGDIVDAGTARTALQQSKAEGVMIGRGAQGKPWILAQVAAELHGTPMPVIPTGKALVDMISGHYEAMLSFYGADLGRRVSRKHMGWYMDGVGTQSDLRRLILTATDPSEVLRLIPEAMATQVDA